MATSMLEASFSAGLRNLCLQVERLRNNAVDVAGRIDVLISSAGPQLSDLSLTELHHLACILSEAYDGTQSHENRIWNQVHDLIHTGLTKLASTAAPKIHQSGYDQLIDLQLLASIKHNMAEGQSICPIMDAVPSCHSNASAAMANQKLALSLLPMEYWVEDDVLPFHILEGGVHTLISLKVPDRDGICQLIARVLSSTQTRKKVVEIANKARDTLDEDVQEVLEEVVAETFRIIDLNDAESMPVPTTEVNCTGILDVPEGYAESPVMAASESADLLPLNESLSVDIETDEDETVFPAKSTSSVQQIDNVDTNIDGVDSLQHTQGIAVDHSALKPRVQNIIDIIEGVSEVTTRIEDSLCQLPQRSDLKDALAGVETHNQDLVRRFDRLESLLFGKEAENVKTEDLQAIKTFLRAELVDEKAAHAETKRCFTVTEYDFESAKRDSALQIEQLKKDNEKTGNALTETQLERSRLSAKLMDMREALERDGSHARADLAKARVESDSLQMTIYELEARIGQLKTEKAKDKRACHEMRDSFERDSYSGKTEIDDLRIRLETAHQDMVNMVSQIQSLGTDKDRLEEELSANEHIFEELQGRYDNAQHEKEAIASRLESFKVHANILEKASAAKVEAYNQLRELLDTVHSDQMSLIASLAEEKASLKEALTAKEEAQDRLCERISSLHLEKLDTKARVEALEGERDGLKGSLATEMGRRQELQDQFGRLQSDKEAGAIAHAKMNCTMDDLKESLATSQEVNIKLQKCFDGMHQEKEICDMARITLEAEKKAMEGALAAKQKDFEAIQVELEIRRAENKYYSETFKGHATKIRALTGKYNAAQNARQEAEANLERVNAVLREYEHQSAALASENNSMTSAFEACKSELEAEKEAHKMTKESLSDTKEYFLSKTKNLQSSLTDTELIADTLLEANTQLESDNATLTSELEAAAKTLDTMKAHAAATAVVDTDDVDPATPEGEDADSDADSWVGCEDTDDSQTKTAKKSLSELLGDTYVLMGL